MKWGLGRFARVGSVYSCQDRGPGASHFLWRAFNRVSVSEGYGYKCQSAEGSVAILNSSRTCVEPDLQSSESPWSHVDL